MAGSPYAIVPTAAAGTGLGNYTIAYANGSMTVTPASLTITAKNQTKVYGQTVTLAGSAFTETGLVNNDSVTSVTLASAGTAATATVAGSPYAIVPTAAVGTGLSNYTIAYSNGSLTVTPASLTITANNQTKVFGQTVTLAGSAFTESGLLNSDKVTSVTLTSTGAAASATVAGSPYPIVASAAVGTGLGNYAISYANGTLAVSQDNTTTTATASTTAGALGQTITITATVSANSPGSGTPTGTVDFLDASTGVDLGKVSLSSGSATLSTTALAPGSHSITVTYSGDSNFLTSATTASTITIGQSIIVLDPSAGGALTISGNASIKMTGGVYIDSSSTSALSASGNAQITASVIDVKGGVSKSGNAAFNPTPVTKAASVSDPLAGLPIPSTTGLSNYGSYTQSGNSTATISAGIYSQINVSGNAKLTMNAGTYIIEGGGFSVSGNAAITGNGVTIYNAGSKFPSSGGTYGAINLSGNGTYKLTPPTTGPYANILFLQPAYNTQVLTYSGNAMAGVSGTIYAPGAQLVESGNAQLNAALVVDTLTLSGNSISNIATLAAPQGSVAYSPAQVRAAYGINSLSFDGTGETIAIVDAYDNPTIYPALDAFDTQFGATATGPSLYDQYGPASSFLTIVNQQGQTTSLPAADPNGPGTDNWEVEESLDVEWAHAVAPGARIVLVEASSQSLSDLMASMAIAASEPGVSVVSMSWGFAEGQAVSSSDEAAYDALLQAPGVAFVASTGDYGAADPEYPAYSPNVVAVGGTTLTLATDNSYDFELGWGDFSSSQGTTIGSGGGISQFESEPAYQQGVQSTGGRTIPDVALVADPATGAWIADPYNASGDDPFEVVGGTSLSAPAWAGLLALANQGRAAAGAPALNSTSPTEAQQALYMLPQSDYNVIAGGNNGYSAQAGYNLVTGLGTPDANLLIPDLVSYHGPATTYSGSPVAPLQDATLGTAGSNTDSSQDTFNVFDSLTFTAAGLGHTDFEASRTVLSAPAGQVPLAVATARGSTSTSVTTIFIYAPAAAPATTVATAPSIVTAPSASPIAISSPAQSQGSAFASNSTSFVQQRTRAQAGSPSEIEADEAAWRYEYVPASGVHRKGPMSESVLDDLVTSLAGTETGAPAQSIRLPRFAPPAAVGTRADRDDARLGGPGLAPVPAGPLSRSEQDRRTEKPADSPAEVILVAGFCGFGAGLLAGRKPRSRILFSRSPAWNRDEEG